MLKKIFVLLVSTFTVLLLAIVIAVVIIDEETIKGWVSGYIEQQYERNLEVTGDLKLDLLSLQPSLMAEGIKLENAKWAEEPIMADIGKVFVQFKLLPLILGNIKILDAEISDSEIYLVKQQTKSNWDVFAPEEKDEKPGYFALKQLENFQLNNVRVNYTDAVADETHTAIAKNFELEDFYSAKRKGFFRGQLDSIPVSFEIDQKSVEAEGVDRLLVLTGHVGAAEVFFTGDIADDFSAGKGRVRVKGPGESLTRIAGLAGLDTKPLHAYDLFATVDANIAQTKIALTEIDFQYGQSQVQGMVKAEQNGEKTLIRGDLNLPVLVNEDLESFLKKDAAAELKEEVTDMGPEAKEKEAEKKSLFDDKAIGPLIPAGLEVYLQTEVEKFIGNNWTRAIQGGEINLAIKEERLALHPVMLKMLNGVFAVEGLITQTDELIEANLKLNTDDFELKRIFEDLANLDKKLDVNKIIGGNLDVVANLQFSGKSPQGMASSLTGDFNFAVEDGYIGSLLVEVLQFDVTETVAAWLADNPKTDINCMVGLFDINSGRVTTQSLVLNTDDSNIIGEGMVNLNEESVDYLLVARAKDFSITGAPIKMKVEGSLVNPKLDIGGEDSLLEVAADTIFTPIAEGFKEIFGEDDNINKLAGCARFRDELARIQRKADAVQSE